MGPVPEMISCGAMRRFLLALSPLCVDLIELPSIRMV
jgi:hypothetical protein